MKDFLCSIFPNYTAEMYEGNKPVGKGHKLTCGKYADRWECYYGCGETLGKSVLVAHINLNHKVSVFICGDILQIIDIRYSGKSDVWGYNSEGEFQLPLMDKKHLHILEPEKIEEILSTDLPGLFWQIVKNSAWGIYNKKQKG